ncbi:hypothetical protein AGDE_01271 [Angomonas deanei]|uniref:Uncharacterized protein n=1 Tax=Angomonas deanei TaxID=59799 RepID=S9VIQ1_9TRYP|nr:hypothetical protein AGDE_07428 [Angomonas deanei]EPY35996.1 hypothetical protein AGDE_07135 [Angomonas deanei]EPY40656.1 hypothetical protein AGDE_03272 [Angomonas deanei]EPY41416.1 hypothetical protein AGDE_02508 [Angomonas deanei]EPY42652.1 hypothetical protein AGDE_01271 [Angomonas deanei]|eukprot:EPY35356.1 hypothetical protein AGDE_07428 [Angomonas deanei]
MAKKKKTNLETTPDLAFVKSGDLNVIIFKTKEEQIPISVTSEEFLEDKRIIKSSNMDQVTFNKDTIFKATLDFIEPVNCVVETAVRESTDWMLCSCVGTNAFYSKVEKRLVLQQCTMSLQSTVRELEAPFIIVLYFDDDQWIVERVLR